MKLTLYGRIPSKKNSKNIIKRGNRTFLVSSTKYIEWENKQLKYIIENGFKKLDGMFSITCNFYMPDRRKTDLSNKFESVADCLVKANILKDDNYEVLRDVHLYYSGYSKENPRVDIEITETQ